MEQDSEKLPYTGRFQSSPGLSASDLALPIFSSGSERSTAGKQSAEAPARLARKLHQLGLSEIALLFLELHRPLNNIAYNASLLFQPVLSPLFGSERIQTVCEALSTPEKFEALVSAVRSHANSDSVKPVKRA